MSTQNLVVTDFFGEIFSVDKKMSLLYTLAPLKNKLPSASDYETQ